ncbi:MAG: rubrerythrin [Leptospira sp.]|nr:rubrerythrin [Leptospira sp.]
MADSSTTLAPNSISGESIIKVLRKLTQDKNTHALWLNTVSLLEHIGSRKILMTQSGEDTSEMILRHATEEARHALFFKKAARQVLPEFSFGYEAKNLVRGTAAKIYFAKLDASVRKELKSEFENHPKFSYLAYLYTTTVIEERAMVVYNLYDEVLKDSEENLQLRNLILEEEGHLEEMTNEMSRLDPNFRERLARLLSKESKLFGRFWRQIEEFSEKPAVF